MITENLLQILCTVLCLVLSVAYCHDELRRTQHIHPIFQCENTSRGYTQIPLYKRCDGTINCPDASDEPAPCVTFYYSVGQSNVIDEPIIRGFYLQDSKLTFRTTIVKNCDKTWKLLGAVGPYLYLQCANETSDNIIRMTRNGTIVNTVVVQGSLKGFTIDEVTSNIYIIEDYHIKMCDESATACTLLKSKFVNRPSSLAFYSKEGYLFWSEEKSDGQFVIMMSLRDGSSPIMIKPNSNKISSLYVNPVKKRLYWLNNTVDLVLGVQRDIVSSDFNGTNQKVVKSITSNTLSFVTYDDVIFYPVGTPVDRVMTINENSFQNSVIEYAPALGKTKLGENVVIYDPSLLKNQVRNPCNKNICSHFCTFISSENTSCYCPDIDNQLKPASSKTFCPEFTLLAAHGKEIYSIGLFADIKQAPVIHKLWVSSSTISDFVYNSNTGEIIYSDYQKQNIYRRNPQKESADLIYSGDPNSIEKLQYDHIGDNVYWINSLDHSIRVISLVTRVNLILYQGNSSHVPFQIGLHMATGRVFMMFSNANSTVTLESMDMEGQNDTLFVICRKNHIHPAEVIFFFMKTSQRNEDSVCILFLSNDEIECWHTYFYFGQTILVSGKRSTITSFIFLNERPYWTENNSMIHVGKFIGHNQIESIKTIPLSSMKDVDGNKLKLQAVENVLSTPLLTHDGGCLEYRNCSHVCLVSTRLNALVGVCKCGSKNSSAIPCLENSYPKLEDQLTSTEIHNNENDSVLRLEDEAEVIPKRHNFLYTQKSMDIEKLTTMTVKEYKHSHLIVYIFILFGTVLLICFLSYVYKKKVKDRRAFYNVELCSARLELINSGKEY